MAKKSNKIIIIMFILFLLSINVLNIITSDRKFSEFENRMLAQFPSFKIKYITSGRFTSKFEEYVTDQFAFRDFWVSIKSDIERVTLKTKNHGIFFGKDGYLLEDYNKPNKCLDENISSINSFSEKLPNVTAYLLIAPNSVKIYEDKLPLFASPYNQLETIQYVKENLDENIDFVEVYDILNSKKDEYIYFKTDHHWTMRGAYYAYQVLSNYLGVESYKTNNFDTDIVSDEFYGTFYSRANNTHIAPDSIEVFYPKSNVKYEVNYFDNNKATDTLYEVKYLDKKDKYSFFLDGNHALMTIKTNVKNNKKIAIFKDSYAHCFIPFLTNHYEEIHVIDLRYYNLSVYEYMEEHDIGEALFLYNVTTFSADENIKKLK